MTDADIAIIGGGASCVLLLSALAELPQAQGFRVDLYERVPDRLGRGIAYSTTKEVHLLNVRAENMSAVESDRSDFAHWAGEKGFKPSDFVPRKLYGAYLQEKLEQAENILALNIINRDAEQVEKDSGGGYAVTSDGRQKIYRRVVLASGNVNPQRPVLNGEVEHYYDDPWSADYAALAGKNRIALIGSGLTAVDTILALYSAGYTGKVSILSRHALPPASHAAPATYYDFLTAEDEGRPLAVLLRQIRAEAGKAAKEGVPWQAVIDSLRSHTNPVWSHMDERTRGKFLKRCFTLWNIHRHRMAPDIGERLTALRQSGQVEFVKAGVDYIAAGPVVFTKKGRFEADAVINCMGYRYKEEGREYDVSDRIGPVRFGELFETTAIPEIRAQATIIAREIL